MTTISDPREIGAFFREKIKASGLQIKQVAEQAGMPDPSYLSQMLAGRVNLVESNYFPAIARILQLTEDEIRTVNPSAFISSRPLTDAEKRGWVLPPEPEEDLTPSPALQEAIDRYAHGKNAAMGEERWLRVFANTDFREEPETAEEWFEVFLSLKKVINPR